MSSDLKNGESVKAGLQLYFRGDGQHHSISISDEDVQVSWDGISLVVTVDFGYHSLSAANNLYWEMQQVVPKLRKDTF